MSTSFLEVLPPAFSEPKGGPPSFENQTCLGKFVITKDRTCISDDVEVPNLIPEQTLPAIIGAYLGTDHASAVLMRNYKAYQDLKHKFFLQWIIDNQFFTGVEEGYHKKPDFICFDKRIADSMVTPWITRFGDWEIYAAKVHDCIYLWTDKHAALPHSMESYYGVYYEHLLTHEDPTECVPDEYNKVNVVNEITFGPHQFLCLAEIDALNGNGQYVELRVFRKCSALALSAKQLRCWARCVIPGVHSVIVGRRDDSGHLLEIESKLLEAMPRNFDWKPEACYNFQNRLLNWIKTHFTGNDPKIVKKFTWACGSNRVYSSDVITWPKNFLPQWYLDGIPT